MYSSSLPHSSPYSYNKLTTQVNLATNMSKITPPSSPNLPNENTNMNVNALTSVDACNPHYEPSFMASIYLPNLSQLTNDPI